MFLLPASRQISASFVDVPHGSREKRGERHIRMSCLLSLSPNRTVQFDSRIHKKRSGCQEYFSSCSGCLCVRDVCTPFLWGNICFFCSLLWSRCASRGLHQRVAHPAWRRALGRVLRLGAWLATMLRGHSGEPVPGQDGNRSGDCAVHHTTHPGEHPPAHERITPPRRTS